MIAVWVTEMQTAGKLWLLHLGTSHLCCSLPPPSVVWVHLGFYWVFRVWEGMSELPFFLVWSKLENASVRLKPGFPSAEVTGLPQSKHISRSSHSCVVLVREAKRFNLWLQYFSFLSPPCRSFLFRWFSELIPILLQEAHEAVIAQSLSVSLLI